MNAIDFDCPECGAKAGQRCNTQTGKATPVSHARRKRFAFDEKMRREADEGAPVAPTRKLRNLTNSTLVATGLS
jgi:hypothetical protein